MYNKDGTAIRPEKTSKHDLIVDPGSIVTGFCNSTTPISLGVANKVGSGGEAEHHPHAEHAAGGDALAAADRPGPGDRRGAS